jgi:pancreatic triacylglycerol lipase
MGLGPSKLIFDTVSSMILPNPICNFFLVTREEKQFTAIEMEKTSIQASSFNKNHPTRILIHGWHGGIGSDINRTVIKEYLNFGDFNCIVLDWSAVAANTNYTLVLSHIKLVANYAAKFIDFLVEEEFLSLCDLNIVGHSLG